ncbi:MAG TPA: M23 family metallopeptidase [Actinocatenispora sp.]
MVVPKRFRSTGRHHRPTRPVRRVVVAASAVAVVGLAGAGAAYAATGHDEAASAVRPATHSPSASLDAERRALQERATRGKTRPASPSPSASRSASPSPSPSKTKKPVVSWSAPVRSYTVTSEYGPRWGTNHPGVDLAVPTGTPVYAAHSGTVTLAGWDGGYGNGVEIDDGGGISTVYGHNSSVVVSAGQQVRRGQLIAYAGATGDATGPHVHFELRLNGTAFDPLPYLKARGLDLLNAG